jgi:adenine-specific DNA-methyltransferase
MPVTQIKKQVISLKSLESWTSPYEALNTGRILVKAWVGSIDESDRLNYGRSFVYALIKSYWQKFYPASDSKFELPKLDKSFIPNKLDITVTSLAESLGNSASKLGLSESSFLIGEIYTASIPESERSKKGVYFTPPSLVNRLLNLIEEQGVEWNKISVLDPACGGGAFLAPVALRIVANTDQTDPALILSHIENHIKGYEIDFFSAWLSQVFVEIALCKFCINVGRRLKSLVELCDTLKREPNEKFDLIIGNPPYGKIKLEADVRAKFKESLYGHANLYGLFTHIALRQINHQAVIAYVTPTSFLSGEYFKNLRHILISKTNPKVFDFIVFRKGVFEDVLQETMLAIYKENGKHNGKIFINEIHPEPEKPLVITKIGSFNLPKNSSDIWILPRNKHQAKWAYSMESMNARLSDWGYEVKTGELVWNRHKSQISDFKGKKGYPLIWAECITMDGKFFWRADKRDHKLFFNYKDRDEWLLTDYPCILLQRTTAKEQQRRLISTILPKKLIDEYGSVVIENHINIIKPIDKKPKISLKLLSSFLNSRAADTAFRCISGSVAVSAYELETMPLPDIKEVKRIQKLIDMKVRNEIIEIAFLKLYSLK